MRQKNKKGMNTKSRKSKSRTRKTEKGSITVGNISDGTGIAVGHGARTKVIQINGVRNDEITQVFELLRQRVAQSTPSPEKDVAENALRALEVEARKGAEANESSVQKWLNFLAETLPDAWDVAIDIFINPIKGAGTVFRKIAERAKAERDAKKTEVSKK